MSARAFFMVMVALALSACGGKPPVPDWQMNAYDSIGRAAQAYLSGDTRIEAAEFERARANAARTGRAELVARLELSRCAWRVASLVFEDCAGFAPLAADAGPAERAYAAYLGGTPLEAEQAALLPEAQRPVAAASASAETLARIEDPLSRLVAAGVLLRRGASAPGVIANATDTASAQGWRRPLLAWLELQAQRAQAAGDADAAARVRRRIALVAGTAPRPAGPASGAAAGAPAASGAREAAFANAFRTLRTLDCARCHGRDHDGPGAPSLVAYAADHAREQFAAAVLDGNPGRGMPPYRTNALAASGVGDLYVYFKARADGVIDARWRP